MILSHIHAHTHTHMNTGKIKTKKQTITAVAGGHQMSKMRESVIGGEFVEGMI